MSASLEGCCPKCGHRKAAATAVACPRCGLMFALWNPEQTPRLTPLDPKAESLWRAAEAAWQSYDAHDAFLKYCSLGGLLPAAGRHYRVRLDQDPTDVMAQQMQKRVLTMATALLGSPQGRPAAPFTRSTAFWIVLACSLFAGIVAALMFGR